MTSSLYIRPAILTLQISDRSNACGSGGLWLLLPDSPCPGSFTCCWLDRIVFLKEVFNYDSLPEMCSGAAMTSCLRAISESKLWQSRKKESIHPDGWARRTPNP